MTTTDLQYPVRYCHFCDYIMFYNRYENGEHYAHCNNHAHHSCMGFSYRVVGTGVQVKEFTLAHTDILYFKARTEKTGEIKTSLLVADHDGTPQPAASLIQVDLQVILNKKDTRNLLEKIRKTILLLD
jgi:hypothetical protein